MIIGVILKTLYHTGSVHFIFASLFSFFSSFILAIQFPSFVSIDVSQYCLYVDQLTVSTQLILENILDDMRQVCVI